MAGRAIRVRFVPALTAGRSKFYSNRSYGQPVYAATFIRKREIILDAALRDQPKELARILIHELFHFAWVRLASAARQSYEALLIREWDRGARGELGWSAESRKNLLLSRVPSPPQQWRDYVCESFCDTAAWLYSGLRRHPEFTLAERHRGRRAKWFQTAFGGREIPI